MLSCFRRSLLVLSRNRVLVHLLQQMQLLQLQCLYPLLRRRGLPARNISAVKPGGSALPLAMTRCM
jgi:hypothetical protein